jgi:hypothetical protein
VPDLLLQHADGGVLVVDVKPAHKMADPRVRAVFDWTATVVGWRGWRFEAWFGAVAVLLANVAFLAGYRRPHVVVQPLIEPVLSAAGDQPTIAGIERAVEAPSARVRPVVLHLLWSGRLPSSMAPPFRSPWHHLRYGLQMRTGAVVQGRLRQSLGVCPSFGP